MPFVSSDTSLGCTAMLPAHWMPQSDPKIPPFRDCEVKNGIQAPHVTSSPKKEHFRHNSNTVKALQPCAIAEKTGGVTVYGYRHYTPKTGQFLGRDPIGERGGMNLYGFVGNEPIWHIDVLGLVMKKKCVFEVVGGHDTQVDDAEENHEKDKEKNPCNRFYGAACFRSPNGGYVWPTPEARDKRGDPGDATIGEELMRLIQQGEKDALNECEDKKTCCSSIELKVRCRSSPSMQTARDYDPLAKRACNYGNTYDCKGKKWSKPFFK